MCKNSPLNARTMTDTCKCGDCLNRAISCMKSSMINIRADIRVVLEIAESNTFMLRACHA